MKCCGERNVVVKWLNWIYNFSLLLLSEFFLKLRVVAVLLLCVIVVATVLLQKLAIAHIYKHKFMVRWCNNLNFLSISNSNSFAIAWKSECLCKNDNVMITISTWSKWEKKIAMVIYLLLPSRCASQ